MVLCHFILVAKPIRTSLRPFVLGILDRFHAISWFRPGSADVTSPHRFTSRTPGSRDQLEQRRLMLILFSSLLKRNRKGVTVACGCFVGPSRSLGSRNPNWNFSIPLHHRFHYARAVPLSSRKLLRHKKNLQLFHAEIYFTYFRFLFFARNKLFLSLFSTIFLEINLFMN